MRVRLADFCTDKDHKGKNQIFGFFHDKKEMHYIVTRARIEESLRLLFTEGRLEVEGYRLPPPPPELVKLREQAAPAAGNYSVIKVQKPDGGGEPYRGLMR